jgi:N-acetylmuramoyl-L-alanine amidase
MNKKEKARVVTLSIFLSLLLSVASPIATLGATNEREYESYSEELQYFNGEKTVREKYLSSVKNKNTWNYSRFNVNIKGSTFSVKGFNSGGVDYIPFRAAANALGLSYVYNSSTKTATMNGGGLTLIATDGCYSVSANDRPLFASSSVVIMNDGRMYIPLQSFAKATGLTVSRTSSTISLGGSFKALTHASSFYRSDEVLWLARIIHAESSGESLLGKIAVGNVVLNRVKSASYPNTIYGVIFDRKYGVQFSPVLNGTIYNTPSYESTLAAKICLEGFNISEGALFFLHPEISTSHWIPNTRPYLFSIGNHDFYG